MKKIIILILALAIIGCAKEKTYKNELTVGVDNEIATLDPPNAKNIYDLQVTAQIHDGLVELDENNQIKPEIAENYLTKDFKTWKFKIRNDVYFHNGKKLDPNDVLYTFKHIMESNSAWILNDIVEKFELIQPDTFVIILKKPEPFFIHRITSPIFSIIPSDGNPEIGTGPFKLVKKTETEIILQKNEKYFKKTSGNVEKIRIITIKNPTIKLQEFKNKKLDLITIDPELIPEITNLEKKFEVKSFPTFNIHFIGFNTQKINQTLRQQINTLIDRQEITQNLLHNLAIPNKNPIPAGIWNINIETKPIQPTPTSPNEKQELTLITHDKYNAPLIAQVIQSQLEKNGIKIKIKQVDFNTAVDYIIKGKTDMFLMFFEFIFSSPEPILYNLFHSSKIPVPNFWNIKDNELDKLLEELYKPHSEKFIEKIIEKVNQKAPLAVLFTLKNTVACQPEFKNIYFNAHDIPLFEEIKVEKK